MFLFFTYYYDICKSSIIFPNVIDCAKAVMDSIKSAINKETFIKKLYNKGWKTNWSENRKYITFINNEGKKVRNSNIEKTFNIKSQQRLDNHLIFMIAYKQILGSSSHQGYDVVLFVITPAGWIYIRG